MAKQPMLKFVSVEKEMPEKRPPNLRREDFNEIYAEYAQEKAKEQAGRCSQCGVPYCQSHCPLHNNIPDWLILGSCRSVFETGVIAASRFSFTIILVQTSLKSSGNLMSTSAGSVVDG